MYKIIGDKLFTIVSTVVTKCYNYDRKLADEGYPYATISPAPSTENVFSSNRNELTIAFNISVYVRNANIATEEDSIRILIDSILALLRADDGLTGSCLKWEFGIEWGYVNDEQPTRVATIKTTYTTLPLI